MNLIDFVGVSGTLSNWHRTYLLHCTFLVTNYHQGQELNHPSKPWQLLREPCEIHRLNLRALMRWTLDTEGVSGTSSNRYRTCLSHYSCPVTWHSTHHERILDLFQEPQTGIEHVNRTIAMWHVIQHTTEESLDFEGISVTLNWYRICLLHVLSCGMRQQGHGESWNTLLRSHVGKVIEFWRLATRTLP